MNAKQAKKLRKIAKDLPVVMEMTFQLLPGSILIKQGFKNSADGKEIDPEKTYRAKQPKQVEHTEKIKNIYTKHGMKAVDEYCAYVKNVAAKEQISQKEITKALPEWFDTDNVHEVGDGIINYTEHGTFEEKDKFLLATLVNEYIGSAEYEVTDVMLDSKVNIRCYILKK